MKILIVVDMQNDFIDGALGSSEAQAIVPYVCEKIKSLNKEDEIIATLDTHNENYLETLEGQKLPIKHCIIRTEGWKLNRTILRTIEDKGLRGNTIMKWTFGSIQSLSKRIRAITTSKGILRNDLEIEICGLCTDICVISNALILRADFPNIKITCDAKACAGTSIEAHKAALTVMKSCQIDVYNED